MTGPSVMPIIAWPVAKERLENTAVRPMNGRPSGEHGRKTAPRLDPGEIFRAKFGRIAAERINDAAHAGGIDVLVQARDFHRAANAQRPIHRRHRDARLGEDRADLRQLAWLRSVRL